MFDADLELRTVYRAGLADLQRAGLRSWRDDRGLVWELGELGGVVASDDLIADAVTAALAERLDLPVGVLVYASGLPEPLTRAKCDLFATINGVASRLGLIDDTRDPFAHDDDELPFDDTDVDDDTDAGDDWPGDLDGSEGNSLPADLDELADELRELARCAEVHRVRAAEFAGDAEVFYGLAADDLRLVRQLTALSWLAALLMAFAVWLGVRLAGRRS